jgi:hypothetical protein
VRIPTFSGKKPPSDVTLNLVLARVHFAQTVRIRGSMWQKSLRMDRPWDGCQPGPYFIIFWSRIRRSLGKCHQFSQKLGEQFPRRTIQEIVDREVKGVEEALARSRTRNFGISDDGRSQLIFWCCSRISKSLTTANQFLRDTMIRMVHLSHRLVLMAFFRSFRSL